MIMPHTHHTASWCVKDLRELRAPLMICGGVYGNLEAFQALIEKADDLKIPAENIIHTGDIIACCADPLATIELMVGCNIQAIQGNVENSLVRNAKDCGCEGAEGAVCDAVLSAQWYRHLDKTLECEHRRYIGKLPHQLTFRCEGKTVRVVHGSVSSISQFIFASASTEVFKSQFELADADIIISGHSGIPFTRRFGDKIWHNSGGLGLPANDGTHRVWYSLVLPDPVFGVRFEHHSLSYDFEKARDKMKFHRLPESFADTLRTGLWPNQDKLPAAERLRAGKPLRPEMLTIDDRDFTTRSISPVEQAVAL